MNNSITYKTVHPSVAEVVVIEAGIAWGAWAKMSNGARRYFSGSMPSRYLAVQVTEKMIKEAAPAKV